VVVDPLVFFAGAVVLIVSLAMTAAFFVLNSKLEDQNKRMREQLEKQSGQK
jgi:hypothetical protein